jgi:hypothetical protein
MGPGLISFPAHITADCNSSRQPFILAWLFSRNERFAFVATLEAGVRASLGHRRRGRSRQETAGRYEQDHERPALPAPGRAWGSIPRKEKLNQQSGARHSGASCDGRPKSRIPPVVNGFSSGTTDFPSRALTIGAAKTSAMLRSSFTRRAGARPCKDYDPLRRIQQIYRTVDLHGTWEFIS